MYLHKHNMSKEEYMRFVSRLSEEEIDSLGDDYTSCWLFAYYIHKKYHLPISDYDPVLKKTGIPELRDDMVYSFRIDCDQEMHYFSIRTENETQVRFMSTYGGQRGVIDRLLARDEFVQGLYMLLNNPTPELYKRLFFIPSASVKAITNVQISYDNTTYATTYTTC